MSFRRIIIAVALLFATSVSAVAQQLTMSIKDEVVECADDLDARVYFPKMDMNDEVCTLLKVTPTNPLKEKLILEVGGLGVVARVEQENGEIWFYLPAKVKNLRFSCAGYSTPPTIPVNFKSATVYRLTIHTDAVFQTVQNAVLNATFLKIIVGVDGAVVSLGRTAEYEMVSKNLDGKIFTQRLNFDTYHYKVEHPLYETATGIVEVKAGLKDLHIDLKPAYGYLNITSSPSGASLYVDGKKVGTTPWSGEERFGRGRVEVKIQTDNYYPLRQEIAIVGRGEAEKFHFDLRPQFGTVECVCDDAEAELWIDEEYKGKGRWTGPIGSLSQHILEARRAGHQSQSVVIAVKEGGSTTCRVGAPVALYGMLELQTTPELCEIKVDGVPMGTTPTILSLLVGKHKVELSADGYQTDAFDVEIAHNQTSALAKTLKVKSVSTPTSAPAPAPTAAKTYKVGDLYDDGVKRGVVFEVSADGKSGKIVSLEEPSSLLDWNDAQEWCASQGAGWYLPSKDELLTLYEVKKIVNQALRSNGFKGITSVWYWSCTEIGSAAWYVSMNDGDTFYYDKSSYNLYARAVSSFGLSTAANSAKPTTSAVGQTYVVGDLYDDGTKRGIVFEVSVDGKSGKIVSLEQPSSSQNWNDAQEWCATQGAGWYLPSKDELLTLYKEKRIVNHALRVCGFEGLTSVWYWSSTEGGSSVRRVNMNDGSTDYGSKYYYNYVRAVSAFGSATIADKPAPAPAPAVAKTYKVGDLYDDGTKRGVVFEVSADGKHGKIVSLEESRQEWATDDVHKNATGATSKTDGAMNMQKIQRIRGWQEKYPAFAWCASLGEGWYLPAKSELLAIYKAKPEINATLEKQGLKITNDLHWSSTEYRADEFCAWFVNMSNGLTFGNNKFYYYYVRAVSAF